MNRQNILKNLVEFSKTLDELSYDLSSLNWDYEEEPFIVYSNQIVEVLNRYIVGEFNSHEIETWANLIECREDIKFEEEKEDILENIIYQLANPVLEGDITPKLCTEMIRIIDNRNKEKEK